MGLSESDEVELKERNGMAMGSVPERYLDAWARLQCQRPAGIDEPRWIDAAGRFLDQWGSLAAGFSWKAGDLFDCPNADGAMGLTWWLRGRGVSAVGPVNAVANVPGGPAYDRTTHRDRIEPHARRGQPEYLSPLEYQMAVIRRVHGGGR